MATALAKDAAAQTFFDQLALTHRQEWVRWIEDRVNRSWERSKVPGMVAVVVHEDPIVWSGGVGVASDHTSGPTDANTHFFGAIGDGAATPHDVVAALSRQLADTVGPVSRTATRAAADHVHSGLRLQ